MNRRLFRVSIIAGALALAGPAMAQNLKGDEALSKILPNAAGGDADGDFYFCDLGSGTGSSRIPPDGRFIACVQDANRYPMRAAPTESTGA